MKITFSAISLFAGFRISTSLATPPMTTGDLVQRPNDDSLYPPMNHSPPSLDILRRNAKQKFGLYVDEESCAGDRIAHVTRAIDGAGLLAMAGYNGLSERLIDFPGNPAPWFFANYHRQKVAGMLLSAMQYANPNFRQPPIRVTCLDSRAKCNVPGAENERMAAYVVSPGSDDIVLCPRFFLVPHLQPSCLGPVTTDGLGGVGSTTQEQLMLHEFMHAASRNDITDYAYGTRACHRLLMRPDPSRPVLKNADSFARYAAWAWDVGLRFTLLAGTEDNPLPPRGTCLERFQPNLNWAAGETPIDPYFIKTFREFEGP